jgi:hypothetical protein
MGPDCHVALAAQKAFVSFFADADGLQEAYAAMLETVARRFKDDGDVIGYEIMNEPIASDDDVAAFSRKMAQAIRTVDKKKLIVFEPSATRNFVNAAPVPAAPFAVPGAAYAVHIYTAVFGDETPLVNGTFGPELSASIAGARSEADGWGTPLFVTEYGLGSQTPMGPQWITAALDDFEANFANTTYWLWRDPSVGGWGLFDPQPDGTFQPRPMLVDALSRPYAMAIGGDPVAAHFDGSALTVTFEGRGGVPARHDVFWNRGAPSITCDGKRLAAVAQSNGIYTVDCGGAGRHVLRVAGADS